MCQNMLAQAWFEPSYHIGIWLDLFYYILSTVESNKDLNPTTNTTNFSVDEINKTVKYN